MADVDVLNGKLASCVPSLATRTSVFWPSAPRCALPSNTARMPDASANVCDVPAERSTTSTSLLRPIHSLPSAVNADANSFAPGFAGTSGISLPVAVS